jgi:glyoxylase-like metal-dependent hydrolase (beta-lactamase superfamily II)
MRRHEVYALHLGNKRVSRSQFMYRDRSNDPLIIAFYMWVVLNGPEPVVFDVAFDAEHARARGVADYRDRTDMLASLGLHPTDIRTVVMSHLHWDHWCGHTLFPNARFIVQSTEAAFWTGRSTRHALIMESAESPALAAIKVLDQEGRLVRVAGTHELWEGLQAIPVGGHTPGLQILKISAEPRNVILASDAFHFYENYTRRRPVQVTLDMVGALDAFDTIAELSASGLVIGGHDPSDCDRFERVADGVYRIA